MTILDNHQEKILKRAITPLTTKQTFLAQKQWNYGRDDKYENERIIYEKNVYTSLCIWWLVSCDNGEWFMNDIVWNTKIYNEILRK